MFRRSISATHALPTAHAVARILIISAISTRASAPDELGIVEASDEERFRSDHACRHDGPGERTAPDFVDAADER